MRIAHEAPLSIFDRVQELTDYDYALVHLFEENEEYYNKFVEARDKGREIILDNSIFELEEAFDADKFAGWVEKLKPTWYIIPDVLEDKDGTIANFDSWMEKYSHLPGKTIAVAQGKTLQDMIECYNYLVDKVDKIAISFDYSFFNDAVKELQLPTKYHEWMFGRQMLLATLVENNIIRTDKPHHLLGCGLPQEFKDYRDLNYDWIDSIDTSNPVVHGIKSVQYEEHGLNNKEPVKLFTMMEEDVLASWDTIVYNISKFKEFCNG